MLQEAQEFEHDVGVSVVNLPKESKNIDDHKEEGINQFMVKEIAGDPITSLMPGSNHGGAGGTAQPLHFLGAQVLRFSSVQSQWPNGLLNQFGAI